MARIIVIPDAPHHQVQGTVLMDEEVHPEHLDDEHSAYQLIERLAWAIHDAHDDTGQDGRTL